MMTDLYLFVKVDLIVLIERTNALINKVLHFLQLKTTVHLIQTYNLITMQNNYQPLAIVYITYSS